MEGPSSLANTLGTCIPRFLLAQKAGLCGSPALCQVLPSPCNAGLESADTMLLLFLHVAQSRRHQQAHEDPAPALASLLLVPTPVSCVPGSGISLPPSVPLCFSLSPPRLSPSSSSFLSFTRDTPGSAPCRKDGVLATHCIDSQVPSDVWWCDLMEQSSPCHGPQQLGSYVEGSSEKGDMAAYQASHSHSRIDVGPADVAQSLHQGANSQAEGHGNLQHRGQGLWPVEG